MNPHLFAIGYCGYCACRMEDWEPNHVIKCKKRHEEYRNSKDPVKLLQRIAKALENIKTKVS